MPKRRLTTSAEVIEALGGIQAAAELTGRKYTAAHNWKQFGRFPANTYLVMTTELARLGCSAPAALWDQELPSERPAACA